MKVRELISLLQDVSHDPDDEVYILTRQEERLLVEEKITSVAKRDEKDQPVPCGIYIVGELG